MFKLRRVRTMLRMTKRRLQRRLGVDDISTDVSFLYPPPDGGWGWVVVLAAFVHSMLITGFHNAFGVYMLTLLETFQSSNSHIAWIGSVSYAFIMIFGPVSGILLQKYGAIKVAIIGALVVMFGLISSSYTYDLRVLFLTHGILVGVGSSLASTPGNYVLLPVLTFDLMGPEKMTIAWGFMMAVNAISAFGPPFAGGMYDLFGNYNVGFIVTGICNIAAASILAFIPWLTDRAKQSKKNYLNASVCEVTKTILPWQSPSSSLGSITSSFMESQHVSLDGSKHSLSEYSKKLSVKSLKSILKSEVTSSKSTPFPENGTSTPHRKEDGVIFANVEKYDSNLFQTIESTADLTPMNDEPQSETASFKAVISASLKETEPDASSPGRKDGVIFVDGEKYDSDLFEQAESTDDLRPIEGESRSETAFFKGATSASIKQTELIPHRKEDGVAFLGVEDYDKDQEEQFERATGLSLSEDFDLATSEALSFKRETPASIKQAKGIPHRKEDGVAFLGVEDSDSDPKDHFEDTTDLQLLADLTKPETSFFKRGTTRSVKQEKGLPHRKEDGVAFFDIEDSDSDLQEHLESMSDLQQLADLTIPETSSFKRETVPSVKEEKGMPHRKEDGVAFLEDCDGDLQEFLESATDLQPEHLTTPETESSGSETSASVKHTEHTHSTLHRKGDVM
ncbi:uncharacterized protein LOC125427884 isoform X2 [Sphaerodactylus townsendi]|uniref:uncharacterized protein LOC125427884 isoform X2 n=1 Tax=Sphaerodactylus townsendi TaxID=933632 RepID=UPI002026E200|nr:uncharacterized protein LOC125427884 isoform X2 [Sphaerodactylus townsendi]